MKKTILAAVLPAVLATGSAGAAEIFKSEEGSAELYGRVYARVKKDPGKGQAELTAGSSRAGVSGDYVLTDSLRVFAKAEFGLGGNADYTLKNRLHYMGVSGDFGEVTIGRQWIVSSDVWGAEYSYFFGGTAIRYGTLNGSKHDALVKYNYDSDEYWLAANVGVPNNDQNPGLSEVFAGTSFGDLSLHFGGGVNNKKNYEYDYTVIEKNKEVKKKGKTDLLNTYFEGTAEYDLGDTLIGFTYYNAKLENLQGDGAVRENAFSVGGTHSINDKTTLYSGFEYVEQTASGAGIDDKGDGKNFYIGSVYKFNSWARVYAEYAYADGVTLGFENAESEEAIGLTSVDSESRFGIGATVYF